jgi:hypothetical protein
MSRGKRHVPVRTCVSCGAKRNKGDMLRFVLGWDRRPRRDESGRGDGRGAYACKESSCIEALMNRKRIETLFRLPGGPREKAG